MLCDNALTDTCVGQLANLLRTSFSMTTLDLRNNNLTDTGIENLANDLKRNKRIALNNLLIEGNKYTSKSDATLEALKEYGVKTLTSQKFIYSSDEDNLDYNQAGSNVSKKKKVKHTAVETNNSTRPRWKCCFA